MQACCCPGKLACRHGTTDLPKRQTATQADTPCAGSFAPVPAVTQTLDLISLPAASQARSGAGWWLRQAPSRAAHAGLGRRRRRRPALTRVRGGADQQDAAYAAAHARRGRQRVWPAAGRAGQEDAALGQQLVGERLQVGREARQRAQRVRVALREQRGMLYVCGVLRAAATLLCCNVAAALLCQSGCLGVAASTTAGQLVSRACFTSQREASANAARHKLHCEAEGR